MRIKSFLFTISLAVIHPNIHATEVYAQVINNSKQFVDKAKVNTALVIEAENPVNISGMQWDKDKNALIISEDGIYAIVSEVQCGAKESSSLDEKGGEFYYWLEANGKQIADSGNWIHVNKKSKSNYIENFLVLPLKAGTALRFMFSTTIPDIGVISFRGTELRPVSPGLTVSIFKVGDIPIK